MARHEESFDFFLRSVHERFKAFKGKLSELVATLSAEDAPKKVRAAKEAAEALEHLLAIVSERDHPVWATHLRSELQTYITRHKTSGATNRLMQAIIEVQPQVQNYKWPFEDATASEAIEFEAIFKKHYDKSKAPDLFQKLLDELQEIVDSGKVDSLRAIQALQELIATIRKNMRGTYFATVGTTHFAYAVLKNYLWKQLKEVPGIGTLLDSVSETMEEMDIEMSEVHSQVRKTLSEYAKGDIEPIDYQPHDISQLPKPGDEER